MIIHEDLNSLLVGDVIWLMKGTLKNQCTKTEPPSFYWFQCTEYIMARSLIEQQIQHWQSTNFVCRVILIELRCKWRRSQSLGPYLWYQTPSLPSLWGASPTVANYRRGWTAIRRTTWQGSERGGPMHWPSVQNTSMNRYRTLSTNQVTFLLQECRVHK